MFKKTIFPRELVGEKITIIDHPSLKGEKGVIIDETKTTFVVQTTSGKKRILKNQVSIQLSSGKTLEGKDLVRRPEERIKG